jgi:hypothetical protein
MDAMGTPRGFTLDDGSFVPAEVAAAALAGQPDVPLTYGGPGGPRIGTARARMGEDGLHVTARLDPATAAALADRPELDGLAPVSFAFGEPGPPGALARLAAMLAPWRR